MGGIRKQVPLAKPPTDDIGYSDAQCKSAALGAGHFMKCHSVSVFSLASIIRMGRAFSRRNAGAVSTRKAEMRHPARSKAPARPRRLPRRLPAEYSISTAAGQSQESRRQEGTSAGAAPCILGNCSTILFVKPGIRYTAIFVLMSRTAPHDMNGKEPTRHKNAKSFRFPDGRCCAAK